MGARPVRAPWRIVRRPDEVALACLPLSGDGRRRGPPVLRLGVTGHLDPDGRLVGFGVDNGVDFMGLHDVSAYGLQRGLEYMRQQRPRVRAYASPQYDHGLKAFKP